MSGKKKLDVGLTAPLVEEQEIKLSLPEQLQSLNSQSEAVLETQRELVKLVGDALKDINEIKETIAYVKKAGRF
jgi:hypothetical protein